jgi:hypothetical protein
VSTKIQIKPELLIDWPFSEEYQNSFIFEDPDLINQLKSELQYGNPSCYLISGYRGSGKTSFINKIKSILEKDTIFVSLIVNKHENYSHFLRKLIRQLYLSYSNTSFFIKQTENNEVKKLNEDFSLLYERTFSDVIGINKTEIKREKNISFLIKSNIKKVFPYFLTILTFCNLLFSTEIDIYINLIIHGFLNFLTYGNINFDFYTEKFLNIIIFTFSIIWATINTLEISFEKSKKQVLTDEYSRKTLYDDEIAEYHLFQILKRLNRNKNKIIIVFDELDKIESSIEINKIIADIKCLLLSGLANFFVISGQKLYYQFEKAHMDDDSVITSIFPKMIHIPLLNYASLRNYCLKLLVDKKAELSIIVNSYFDSLILESSRIPRKLSNTLRNKVNWENDKAYLIINNDPISLKLESALIEIVNKIISELSNINTNKPLIDFIISQIHLWVKKIKLLKNTSFNVTDILDKQNLDIQNTQNNYPLIYLENLPPLVQLFCDRLIEKKILIEGLVITDVNGIKKSQYSWSDEFKNKIDTITQNEEITNEFNLEKNFIDLFKELEEFLRNIYIDLVDGATYQNVKLSFKEMLDDLVLMGVYTLRLLKSDSTNDLLNIRTKLVHNLPLIPVELVFLKESFSIIRRLKAELIEDFTFFVCKNYLNDRKFDVSKEVREGFDFFATLNNITILFDVKYFEYSKPNSRSINEIINKYNNLSNSITNDCYYVLFFYLPNGRNDFEIFKNKFSDFVSNGETVLKNKYYLFFASSSDNEASSARLNSYLDIVLKEVNKQSIYIP